VGDHQRGDTGGVQHVQRGGTHVLADSPGIGLLSPLRPRAGPLAGTRGMTGSEGPAADLQRALCGRAPDRGCRSPGLCVGSVPEPVLDDRPMRPGIWRPRPSTTYRRAGWTSTIFTARRGPAIKRRPKKTDSGRREAISSRSSTPISSRLRPFCVRRSLVRRS